MELKLTIGITPELDAQLKAFMAAFGRPKVEDIKEVLAGFNRAAENTDKLKKQGPPAETGAQDGEEKAPDDAPLPAAEMTKWAKRKLAMAEAEKKKGLKVAQEPEVETFSDQPDEPATVDLEMVQELSRRKAQAGMSKQIKALLTEAGVDRLSDLENGQLAEFYGKLKAL